MKNGIFWDIKPCGSSKKQLGTTIAVANPDDGGAKFLRKVGSYKSHMK
jgi:hypothetical protein